MAPTLSNYHSSIYAILRNEWAIDAAFLMGNGNNRYQCLLCKITRWSVQIYSNFQAIKFTIPWYLSISIASMLVAENTLCIGSKTYPGWQESVHHCAAECKLKSLLFAYGRKSGLFCRQRGCRCSCEMDSLNGKCKLGEEYSYHFDLYRFQPGECISVILITTVEQLRVWVHHVLFLDFFKILIIRGHWLLKSKVFIPHN